MNNLDKIYKKVRLDKKLFSKNYVEYLKKLLDKLDHDNISKCISELEVARENENTIFLIGNGGSASTASHVANDFGLAVLKKTNKNNFKSFKAFALTDNMSVISATANDSSYNNIFLDQLKVHFRPGDKLIAISASGNSPNLISAVQWFKSKGGTSIGWLGFDGGKLQDMVDIPIVVKTPNSEYAPVEDLHLIINHIIVTWMQFNIIHEEKKG